jgi:hypothetical protein
MRLVQDVSKEIFHKLSSSCNLKIAVTRLIALKQRLIRLAGSGLEGFFFFLQTILNKKNGIKFLFLKISSKLFPNLLNIAAHEFLHNRATHEKNFAYRR